MSINDGTATGQELLDEREEDNQELRVSDDYRNAFILQATTPRFLL